MNLVFLIVSLDSDHLQRCNSSLRKCVPSPPAPCVPQNVSAVRECGSNSIRMTWLRSGSTIYYIAVATDSNGVTHSCNSMDLTCTIEGLECSTNYTAHVIATNFMCNSSESETVTMETGTVKLLRRALTLSKVGKGWTCILSVQY